MSKINNCMIIYQTKEGSLELNNDFESYTIWTNQKQIAESSPTDKDKMVGMILILLAGSADE